MIPKGLIREKNDGEGRFESKQRELMSYGEGCWGSILMGTLQETLITFFFPWGTGNLRYLSHDLSLIGWSFLLRVLHIWHFQDFPQMSGQAAILLQKSSGRDVDPCRCMRCNAVSTLAVDHHCISGLDMSQWDTGHASTQLPQFLTWTQFMLISTHTLTPDSHTQLRVENAM